jgi:hypothetical protein
LLFAFAFAFAFASASASAFASAFASALPRLLAFGNLLCLCFGISVGL